MKILAIRGKNIASLTGTFEIDFREEPLRSAGLYAITGKTGSGKTSILDAMCISLYDRSPRLDSIKNPKVVEVNGSKNITESSTKTILSKGAHQGYAETDFLAIDGNEYRVRWTVSRSNDNARGFFRENAYDLYNLTDGSHRKLQKREFEKVIPTLVGLEYEQFTRAVLLSQGNFAAFLKADENEKAQILQTLTGTEIYSRISALIFSRNSEANKEMQLAEAKKASLDLLSDEEVAELERRKSECTTLLNDNEKRMQRLAAEKSWIERSALLARQCAQAEAGHNSATALMQECKPIAEKIALIDSVQEIRDTYTQKGAIGRQKEEDKNSLALLKAKLAETEKSHAAAKEEAEKASLRQKKIQQEHEAFKPSIKKALQIEEQLKIALSQAQESEKRLKTLKQECDTLAASIKKCEKESVKKQAEYDELQKWFSKNSRYEHTIPNIPIIISNLAAISEHSRQIALRRKNLAGTNSLLAESEKRLNEIRKREEELANTLSSEIAALRKRLIEGEPCPVCGSTHHTSTVASGSTLAEEELERAKEEVRKSIEHLTGSIEGYKDEASRLNSAIEMLLAMTESLNCKNIELAGDNANELLSAENAAEELARLSAEWESKGKRLTGAKEEIAKLAQEREIAETKSAEREKEHKEKEESLLATNGEIKQFRNSISALLGEWDSSENAERYFEKERAKADAAVSSAIEKRVSTADIFNRLKGEIDEKERSVASQEQQFALLSEKIEKYLSQRNNGLSTETLSTLMSIGNNEITEMRSKVERCSKALLTAAATLSERRRSLEEHERSASKPAGGKSADAIEHEILEATAMREKLANEMSGINSTLMKNSDNNKLFNQYKEEYNAKKEIAGDWAVLNSMFGNAKGEKLMKYAQGYTLDILLSVANIHLAEFSGRYRMERISRDSLAINVIDNEMMSETRSVHTLSGGETFLASLALSLALSSISSNKMSIESLFIDEGFGALDSETLKSAMEALDALQSKGRKICVISHLTEILERIPVKINVAKKGYGKSKVTIMSNKSCK